MCGAVARVLDPIGSALGINPFAKKKDSAPAPAPAAEAPQQKIAEEPVSNSKGAASLYIRDSGRIAEDTGLQIPAGR